MKLTNGGSVALVAFGPSQVGKSSFVKCLREYYGVTQGEQPILGTGDGRSATCKATIFSVGDEFGLLADMGGWNDSQLRFTGQEMAERASAQLVLQDVQHVRFLVFDSMSGDTSQLRNSIVELVKGFGDRAKDSVIVVASKMDRADPDEVDGRLRYMTQTMEELGISGKRLAEWQNKGLSSDSQVMESQVNNLLSLVAATPFVATDTMQGIRSRIESRAHKLCASQKTVKRSVELRVNETYVTEMKKLEPRKEEYWEKKIVTMSRMDHEMHENPVPAVVSYIFTLGIGAIVSANSRHHKEVWEQKTRTVDEWKTYPVEKTRTVSKLVDVEDPPKPVEYFLPQAREEIASEIRAMFASTEATTS